MRKDKALYHKAQKAAAWILSLLLLAVLLFSAFYLVEEAEHECSGEDCPICECLAWCGSYLRQLCDGTAVQNVCLLLIAWEIVSGVVLAEGASMPTLITWKVRLNP